MFVYGGGIYFDDQSSEISIGGYAPMVLTQQFQPIESTIPSIPGLIVYNVLSFTPAQLAGLSGFYLLFQPTVDLQSNCLGDGVNFTSVLFGLNHSCDVTTWPGVGGNPPVFIPLR